MARFIIVIALAAGCASHQSTAGLVVSDVRIVDRTLAVDRCTMNLAYADDTGAAIAMLLTVCPITFGIVCPTSGSYEHWNLYTAGCEERPSAIGGAP